MANLTSSLTLKLTDLLSKPAGEAAAALRKFGLSAQDLQKSAKLDVFRQLQQSFAAARTTFRDAQQNVSALAKQIAATDSPTKQLTRSFAQAKREVTSASRAFEQQSAAIIAAKTSLTGLGVPLNQIVTEETRLKTAAQAATVAMEQQAQRAQSIGARIRRGMGTAFGNIAPFLGPPILGATYKAMKAGGAVDSAETGLRAAGISASEIESVSKIVMAQQALYPQLPINELLDRYKEERSITTSPAEAQQMLPVIAKTMAVLKTMESAGTAAPGSTTGMGFVMKAAQVLGAAQHPERLTSFMEAFIKAKQVKGDFINPEQMFSFFAGLKGSGALLSDRFLHTTAMSLTAELKGGARAGSGIDAMVKAIVAPVGATAKEFLELGLMSKGDFKPPQQHGGFGKSFGRSPGKLGEVKLDAHVAGWQLAQTDPDKWVAQHLLPALRQKGITDMPAILAMVEKIFPGRSSDVVTKLITQAKEYEREAEKFREAHGGAAVGDYATDAKFQLETLGTALYNFGSTLTKPMMPEAAKTMNSITRTIAEWSQWLSEWNKKHPTIAPYASTAATGVGAVVGGALTYGLVSGLLGGSGLTGLVKALGGSVAALKRSVFAFGSGAEGAVAGAGGMIASTLIKGILGGISTYVVAYEVEKALYNALMPEKTKKEIKRRSDVIDAMKPAPGTTKAEILRRAANSDRQRQRIAPIGDFTFGADRNFRLDAGPNRSGFAPSGTLTSRDVRLGLPPAPSTTASPGDFSNPLVPTEGFRIPLPQPRPAEIGAAPSVALPDQTAEAAAAGHSLAKAFVDSFGTELSKAEGLAEAVANRIIGYLNFSASPDVTPQAGGGGNTGGGGNNAHGIFSDYGVRP